MPDTKARFVSELPGVQQVDLYHTLLFLDKGSELQLKPSVTGSVQHLGDRVPEDVVSHFQNQRADDKAGDRIHEGKSQPGQGYADEGTHR